MSQQTFTVGLLGNPNSGKSSLFNQLTGLRQKVGNFPGVTVDKKIGNFELDNFNVRLIDFPGTYSLHPISQDEKVVLNIISNPNSADYPDAIIYVADILNLEKHLLLFTQLQDLGFPMVMALTMGDIAKKEDFDINNEYLSQQFGCPFITISNRTNDGMEDLKSAVQSMLSSPEQHRSNGLFRILSSTEKSIVNEIIAHSNQENPYLNMLWMHHHKRLSHIDDALSQKIEKINTTAGFNPVKGQIDETMQRYDIFTNIVDKARSRTVNSVNSLSDRLDKWVLNPIAGPIIFFGLMLFVFQAIFTWASIPMDWIDGGVASLSVFFRGVLPEGWLTDLFIDGIIAGLGGVVIFIPQIAILFLLISLLEQVGYMARAVYLFDRMMQRFGLNGRSIVALISGGACAIPAVMSTRTITNWKERLITILVTPFISCSARIPVYIVLIGFVVPSFTVLGIFDSQALVFMGLYLLGIVAALGSAFVFSKILKTEERSYLMMQLPDYQPPRMKDALLNVLEKVKTFTFEAGRIILIISVILWGLATYGPSEAMQKAQENAISEASTLNLSDTEAEDLMASKTIEASYAGHLGKMIEPVIKPLGYDWKMGIALITSFAAREVFVGTMATIYSIGSSDDEMSVIQRMKAEVRPDGTPVYNMATALSLLLFYVFAMQCMSTLAVVKRETKSYKWPIIQFSFMTALAYISALMAYQLLA